MDDAGDCRHHARAPCADIVILHQVLHYLDRPEQAIAEAARLLQPGGMLLVVDFAPHQLEFLRQEHGHRRLGIRSEDLETWASASGLDLNAPRRFAPPDGLDEGLHVNIWRIDRPASKQEIAA